MSYLDGHRFLLHPSVEDLYTCLDHYVAHKSATTSACTVLPKQSGMWRKFLRGAQLLKEYTSHVAMFVPADDADFGKPALQVYYHSPVVTDSVCASIGTLGLTLQFHGTVSGVPVSILLDSGCSHTLMSAAYARRVGIAVEPVGEALHVAVADGMVCSSSGISKVRLKNAAVFCGPVLQCCRAS